MSCDILLAKASPSRRRKIGSTVTQRICCDWKLGGFPVVWMVYGKLKHGMAGVLIVTNLGGRCAIRILVELFSK